MSAMPAQKTEFTPGTPVVRVPVVGAQCRVERRAELVAARRARQRWAWYSGAVMAGTFGLTVGILDVLH
jgi:hypothetical protein